MAGDRVIMTNEELIRKAQAVVNPRQIAHGFTVGDVGCALLTGEGKLHVGVCIDAGGGIGFCAEHSAIASLIPDCEQSIRRIVAVLADGRVLPPCGRCREFMRQIDTSNMEHTEVLLGKDETVKLRELLPHPWDEVF
jgi:cytidine deaminase